MIARILAGGIALAALTGIAIQFHATLAEQGSVLLSLWTLARFFTVISNLFVAAVFGAAALGWRGKWMPSLMGCATIAILLVGIVYAVLLAGLHPLSREAAVASFILHKVTPMLVPLGWLAGAPKGRLTARDPWLWALFPLGYFGYAEIRGVAEGKFAYFFLDFEAHGWGSVLAYALVMAAGFLIVGWGLLWLDRRLATGRGALGES